MKDGTMLDVRGLTVTLPTETVGITALDGISFDVKPGEVLGIVGESGAGKSIAGAAIIDLLVPPLKRTAGAITLAGERIDHLDAQAMRKVRGRRIGYVFQDPMTSLNPVLTVGRQLIDTMRAHLDITRGMARRKAAEWLDRVGLPNPRETLARYPHELSGGMRQRVVIALALCADPVLLIADEPTTALDVSVQAHILQLLRDLHEESGISMILITHDLGVVSKMADRVAVFYAGRVAEISTVTELFEDPRHPYAEGLLQATPRPSLTGRGHVIQQIPGVMPALGKIPGGCAFHPRCSRASEACRTRVPELREEGGRSYSCFHPIGGKAQ
ncbi:MAG: ATP-binding cassette domain-containing protein [Rhodobacteraceae bacterium]|nr:ATP-binding cassette domain-containing protein [Paracoccaceae bacterium]